MDYATYIVKFRTALASSSPIPFGAILSFCTLGNVVREPAMRWLFSGRNAKLENNEPHSNRRCSKKNGAHRRTGNSTGPVGTSSGPLKTRLEPARKRARELEV